MPVRWERTRELLGRRPKKVFMVETMEEEWLEDRLKELPACDTVVGIRRMSRPQGNDPEGITTVMQ